MNMNIFETLSDIEQHIFILKGGVIADAPVSTLKTVELEELSISTTTNPLTVPELNTKLDELSILFSESGFNCYCEYEDWAYRHIEAIEAVHMLSVIEC